MMMAMMVGFPLTTICSISNSSGCNCPSEDSSPGDLGGVPWWSNDGRLGSCQGAVIDMKSRKDFSTT